MFKQMQSAAKVALAVASLVALSAHADPVLTNGTFDVSTSTGYVTSAGINGWTFGSVYSFVATGTGVVSLTGGSAGNFTIQNVGAGSSGQYVAVDTDFGNAFTAPYSLQTTVTGLVHNDLYKVTFLQAGARQTPGTGAGFGTNPFTELWQVALDGGAAQSSSTMSVDSNGNGAGWTAETLTFLYTGNSGSATLSFLASTTSGLNQPPFALLDNVTIKDMGPLPEPAMLSLVGLGLAGLGFVRRKQQRG